MLLQYKPVLLSFIIGISKKKPLKPLKQQLVKTIEKLDTDDRGYVYFPGIYDILIKKGEIVAAVCNFNNTLPFRLEMAVKQTINVLAHIDIKKYIIILVDSVNPDTDLYGLEKCLALDTKNNYECNFIVCDLGECDCLNSQHPRYHYLKVSDISTLGEEIIKIYYPQEERREIDLFLKEQYGKTPAEMKQELKEKYAEDISGATDLPTFG